LPRHEVTDLEWHLTKAVGDVLRAWKRDNRPLGTEAALVAFYPHQPDGKPLIVAASGKGSVVEAAVGKVERGEGPVTIAANLGTGELSFE
jgi:hypothetical protein